MVNEMIAVGLGEIKVSKNLTDARLFWTRLLRSRWNI